MSVRHGMLALLDRRSMYGYELRRELAAELGPEWALNYGQVYSTLERLVRDGLVVQSDTVTSSGAPDRKLYTVTPSGRSTLHQWFLTPLDGNAIERDALYAKILLGLSGQVPIRDVIQVERKAQLKLIGQLTEIKERLDPNVELSAVLQVDLSIMKTQAVMNWLDTAESRIKKSADSPARGVARPATKARRLEKPDAKPEPKVKQEEQA